MCKVISEWKIGRYVALGLDQSPPFEIHHGYRIDGEDYDAVPVYDLPAHIAIEAEGGFLGKTVEFI